MFDIDQPPLGKKKENYRRSLWDTAHFFFHVENRLGIFHFACTNRLGEEAAKAHLGNKNL